MTPTPSHIWSDAYLTGNAYRALGRRALAKAAYNAALLLDPLDARTWNNRGALQEDSGNLVAAELDIRRALELDPGCEHASTNLERISLELMQGDLELRPLEPSSSSAVSAFVFEAGPLGILLEQSACGGVSVAEVEPQSQAEAAGVFVHGVVVALNGELITHVRPKELTHRIQETPRPLVLLVRRPSGVPGDTADTSSMGETADVAPSQNLLAERRQELIESAVTADHGATEVTDTLVCTTHGASALACTTNLDVPDELIAAAKALAGPEPAPPGGVDDGGLSGLSF